MGEREEFDWLVEMCELTPSHEQHHSSIPFLRQYETSLLLGPTQPPPDNNFPSSDQIKRLRVSSSQHESQSKKLRLSQPIDVVVLDDSDSDQLKDGTVVGAGEGTSCNKPGGRILPDSVEDNVCVVDKVVGVGQGTSFDEFEYNGSGDDAKKIDFYDILEMLKLAMRNEDGEEVDLPETAKQRGLEFPRWPHPDR